MDNETNTQGIPTPQPIQQPMPNYGQAYPGAPLTQLSGGMKFAWLVIGLLMGIPGMILAWLTNVNSFPQVKSDAIKFAIIGFIINIAGWFLISLAFGAIFASLSSALMYYS